MNPGKDIHNLRTDYSQQALDESQADASPFGLFSQWMHEALQNNVAEPNAISLSTTSLEGRPSSRIVLLREYSEEGFIFYTNYNSRKSIEIANNPFVSFLLFWPGLERQVRVEGKAHKASVAKSDTYFKSRPKASQIGAWASSQSEAIVSREELDEKVRLLSAQYKDQDVPRPDFWGGWVIIPHYFEFWQGRSNRLHDRLAYNLEQTQQWVIKRLSP